LQLSLNAATKELIFNFGQRSLLPANQCCLKCRGGETKENLQETRHRENNELPAGFNEKEGKPRFRDVSSGLASPVNPWAFHCQMRNFVMKPMSGNKSNRSDSTIFYDLYCD
jgi:hypothetical protein